MWDLAQVQLRGGPGGPPREVVVRVQRDRLFRAMAELGYGEATMRPLLARAKVSRLTFYELFEDREECFLAAYAEAIEDALDAVQGACRAGDSPAERIRSGLRTLLERFRDDPAVARMCAIDVLAVGAAGREARERTVERFAELLKPPLRELYGDGDLVETRTRALIGAVHEAIYQRLARGKADDLPEVVGEIVELYLRPGPG
jgi:AcrR family transcriptional regulator